MTTPVSYVELNSPDLEATTAFVRDVFGWEPQPFAAPDYLVAPHGDGPGIDAGLLASRDGNPRTVPVIRVDSIDALREQDRVRRRHDRRRALLDAGSRQGVLRSPTRRDC